MTCYVYCLTSSRPTAESKVKPHQTNCTTSPQSLLTWGVNKTILAKDIQHRDHKNILHLFFLHRCSFPLPLIPQIFDSWFTHVPLRMNWAEHCFALYCIQWFVTMRLAQDEGLEGQWNVKSGKQKRNFTGKYSLWDILCVKLLFWLSKDRDESWGVCCVLSPPAH